jgi:hypothetical protein
MRHHNAHKAARHPNAAVDTHGAQSPEDSAPFTDGSQPFVDTARLAMTANIAATTGAADLLDEAQAAEYLRQKERTLRIWRAKRGLPHLKPTSKVVLYRRGDLDAWLSKFRCVAKPVPFVRLRREVKA